MAYTVITSPNAAMDAPLIAATTIQFNATVLTNPFFPGTYNVTVNGLNPSYNPPISNEDLLNAVVAASTTNYVPGFADGMTYQQTQEEGLVGSFGINCSSPTAFVLEQTTTGTFNTSTCQDVIATIEDALFEESLSTPTPIPPEP